MTPTTTQPQRSPQDTDDGTIDPATVVLTAAHARAKLINVADQVAYVRGLVVPSGRSRRTGSPGRRAPRRRSRSESTRSRHPTGSTRTC